MYRLLFVFGTRPEAIKLAPVIRRFRETPQEVFDVKVCTTGQHREMLAQTMAFFGLSADYPLDIMRRAQSLFDISTAALRALQPVYTAYVPDMVFVQGDTSTAFIGALAAYYCRCMVAHVEAGLRSANRFSPFPEEANRRMIATVTDLHFAPTPAAAACLRREQYGTGVHMTGNTVIDALHFARRRLAAPHWAHLFDRYPSVRDGRRVILVTGHRRESFGEGFTNICAALRRLALANPDVDCIYPVHLNPAVRGPVHDALARLANVHLCEPVDYPEMIWLLEHCCFVLTDSGGIQEEAPAFGKPVLVMRTVTERMEGVTAGSAKLVGTDPEAIFAEAQRLLDDPTAYASMARAVNPYGDGNASERIYEIVRKHFVGGGG